MRNQWTHYGEPMKKHITTKMLFKINWGKTNYSAWPNKRI